MPDYKYRGLMAPARDTLRDDTAQWEDRFFYLEMNEDCMFTLVGRNPVGG